MAIQEGNILLLKSQRMEDTTEGGGRATGVAISDGASNAIFPDISELDRAMGRVSLRKVSVGVDTPDTEGYMGVNVVISKSPQDARVSCTLFSTGEAFDQRAAAQSRLESYVIAGPMSTMRLYGDQYVGQRAVSIYQREDAPLPEQGEVYVLSQEVGAAVQQFFRVQEIESSIQTFTDDSGDFKRRVVIMTISDALRQTFKGKEPVRNSNDGADTKVRRTTVADASRYYGTRPLAIAAAVGALFVKTDSIYTPLVPSSTTETAITLANVQSVASVLPTTLTAVTVPPGVSGWATGAKAATHLQGGITPGSLMFSYGVTNTYWPKTDDGLGVLRTPTGLEVGAVDYETGVVTALTALATEFANSSSATFTYTPGVRVAQSAFTAKIDITLGTRGSVYQQTVTPAPAPGTSIVDFMALGKWYRLQDDGTGVLSGAESAYGTGSVNYATGAIVVTLGALPDVDSAVLFSWGTPVDTRIRTSGYTGLSMIFSLPGAAPNTVSLSYTKGGVTKTLTDNGAGVLAGSGETGTISYATGEVRINGHRDYATDISATYSSGAPITDVFSNVAVINPSAPNRGTATITAAQLPLAPRTVKLSWLCYKAGSTTPITVSVTDDGAGHFVYPGTGFDFGTVNYTTGEITWTPSVSVDTSTPVYGFTGGVLISSGGSGGGNVANYQSTPPVPMTYGYLYTNTSSLAYITTPLIFPATLTYRTTASATANDPELFAPPLTFDLSLSSTDTMVPGSLFFQLQHASLFADYIDRAGVLVREPSYATGAGMEAGTVDYTNRRVTITAWPDSLHATTPLVVKGALANVSARTAISAYFRTAGAPLRPASIYVQAMTTAGDLLTATSNQNGVINGTGIRGYVDNTSGVISVAFGQSVTAAGNEAQPWYNAALVSGGQIWKPAEVIPDSIEYSGVVTATLPLDATIIGLDPVRLPSDGRVPIFRAGNIIVVHHTASTTPQTVSNGQTVNLGRTRLSRVKVIGNDGTTIAAGYTTDMDAGTVTFTTVAGYSQPIHIEHRIEDMALTSDAQINGQLTLTRQLTHDFPIGSFVSSALIIGDMKARVANLFDQATWSSTWSDVVNGSAAPATFNDVVAPIVVTNKGAITERWSIVFTNTTAYNIIGEHVGVIGTGSTAVDNSPLNPAIGVPYFTLPAAGWGSGWVAGNALRFNTVGALAPIWIARTIQQGPATADDDSFELAVRGDIDRP